MVKMGTTVRYSQLPAEAIAVVAWVVKVVRGAEVVVGMVGGVVHGSSLAQGSMGSGWALNQGSGVVGMVAFIFFINAEAGVRMIYGG